MTYSEKLRVAVCKGDISTVRDLLGKRQPCEKYKDGRSLLHFASQCGHVEVAKLLIFYGFDVASKDINGYTSLHLSAAQGHQDVVRLLIDSGADVNQVDVFGNTPVHAAAWNGYSQTIMLLICCNSNVNIMNKAGFTALHTAAQKGHNQTARVLIGAGAKVKAKNNYGETPLHTATRQGHAGVTQILIANRVKVDSKNKNGETALHVAAMLCRHKIAKMLIEAGANKTIKNKQGETAFDVGRKLSADEDMLLLLLYDKKKFVLSTKPLNKQTVHVGRSSSLKANLSIKSSVSSKDTDSKKFEARHYNALSHRNDDENINIVNNNINNNNDRNNSINFCSNSRSNKSVKSCPNSNKNGSNGDHIGRNNLPRTAETVVEIYKGRHGNDVYNCIASNNNGKYTNNNNNNLNCASTVTQCLNNNNPATSNVDDATSAKINNNKITSTKFPSPTTVLSRFQHDMQRSTSARQHQMMPLYNNDNKNINKMRNKNINNNINSNVVGLLHDYTPKHGTIQYKDLAGNLRKGPIGWAPIQANQMKDCYSDKSDDDDDGFNYYEHIDHCKANHYHRHQHHDNDHRHHHRHAFFNVDNGSDVDDIDEVNDKFRRAAITRSQSLKRKKVRTGMRRPTSQYMFLEDHGNRLKDKAGLIQHQQMKRSNLHGNSKNAADSDERVIEPEIFNHYDIPKLRRHRRNHGNSDEEEEEGGMHARMVECLSRDVNGLADGESEKKEEYAKVDECNLGRKLEIYPMSCNKINNNNNNNRSNKKSNNSNNNNDNNHNSNNDEIKEGENKKHDNKCVPTQRPNKKQVDDRTYNRQKMKESNNNNSNNHNDYNNNNHNNYNNKNNHGRLVRCLSDETISTVVGSSNVRKKMEGRRFIYNYWGSTRHRNDKHRYDSCIHRNNNYHHGDDIDHNNDYNNKHKPGHKNENDDNDNHDDVMINNCHDDSYLFGGIYNNDYKNNSDNKNDDGDDDCDGCKVDGRMERNKRRELAMKGSVAEVRSMANNNKNNNINGKTHCNNSNNNMIKPPSYLTLFDTTECSNNHSSSNKNFNLKISHLISSPSKKWLADIDDDDDDEKSVDSEEVGDDCNSNRNDHNRNSNNSDDVIIHHGNNNNDSINSHGVNEKFIINKISSNSNNSSNDNNNSVRNICNNNKNNNSGSSRSNKNSSNNNSVCNNSNHSQISQISIGKSTPV